MSYAHKAGTAGTVTVPEGKRVRRYSCVGGTGGGTLVITPAGGSAQDTITVPEGSPHGDEFETDPAARDGYLSAGSTLVFTGTSAYWVRYT